MGITGASFHSYTMDADTELKDAGAVTATGRAQVSAADKILDFGGVTSGPAVTQVAYTPGVLVVDVDALDFVTGDESYVIQYQLSDNVAFASGNVAVRAELRLGVAAGQDVDDQEGLGRLVVHVDNEFLGTLFRFASVAHLIAGTTPSINYRAFLSRNVGN